MDKRMAYRTNYDELSRMVAEGERMSGMLEKLVHFSTRTADILEKLDKRVTAIEFEHKYQDTDEDYR